MYLNFLEQIILLKIFLFHWMWQIINIWFCSSLFYFVHINYSTISLPLNCLFSACILDNHLPNLILLNPTIPHNNHL